MKTYTCHIYDPANCLDGPLAIIEQERQYFGKDFLQKVSKQMMWNHEPRQFAIIACDGFPFFIMHYHEKVDNSTFSAEVYGYRWPYADYKQPPHEWQRNIVNVE